MSTTITGLPLAVSIIEFVGSVSSFLGASFIIISYLLLPMKRHFRHTLILNLAIADAINGLCEALSGLQILIHRHDLHPGPGCTLNGLVGQITVQGTDTAIFAIACITVYTITRRTPVQAQWSWRAVIFTWASIWALPFITGFTALGMGWYGPVSGNWCWLIDKPAYMRYVLTHGWRFLFIFLEIGMYIYLHIYLKRHFSSSMAASASDTESGTIRSMTINTKTGSGPHVVDINGAREGEKDFELKPFDSDHNDGPYHNTFQSKPYDVGSAPKATLPIVASDVPQSTPPTTAAKIGSKLHIMAHRREKQSTAAARNPRLAAIQRILLLNAYPLLYIILWLPGLANRLVEASGHESNVTQVMQSTTQFVGLANALTFGWNEEVARQLHEKFARWRRGRSGL